MRLLTNANNFNLLGYNVTGKFEDVPVYKLYIYKYQSFVFSTVQHGVLNIFCEPVHINFCKKFPDESGYYSQESFILLFHVFYRVTFCCYNYHYFIDVHHAIKIIIGKFVMGCLWSAAVE